MELLFEDKDFVIERNSSGCIFITLRGTGKVSLRMSKYLDGLQMTFQDCVRAVPQSVNGLQSFMLMETRQ